MSQNSASFESITSDVHIVWNWTDEGQTEGGWFLIIIFIRSNKLVITKWLLLLCFIHTSEIILFFSLFFRVFPFSLSLFLILIGRYKSNEVRLILRSVALRAAEGRFVWRWRLGNMWGPDETRVYTAKDRIILVAGRQAL